ncbi:NeuD/PglB/VioB family sugar acetyltransferase [Microbacterium insulae]|uniref:NeuD/PglB/VioB family sugar acetyltransferase n=1 Tax=Microbacterium insulae TaxID=483014 RepID=A0ABW3AEB1_9MICO
MAEYVILGGGGHARSVIAALVLRGETVRGYVAPEPSPALGPLTHLGDDDCLDALPPHVLLANGLGTTGSTHARRRLHEQVIARGMEVAQVLHPRAFIDPAADLGPGVQVLAGAIVNAGARLAEGALINTGAIVEHDTEIGRHAHVAPGAILAGGVRVGLGALVGLGSRVLPGIAIGADSVVAAGAVVVADVDPGSIVMGIPARPRGDRGDTQ